MKYALMASVSFNEKSQRDNLAENIRNKIASKLLWSNTNNPKVVSVSMGNDGTPTVNVVLRFDNKDDRDTIALYIEDKIVRLPALNGSVTVHKCFHDQPELGIRCEPEVMP